MCRKKLCKICKIEKSVRSFYKTGPKKYYKSICKKCYAPIKKEATRIFHKKYPDKMRFIRLKKKAKQRGIEFKLTFEEYKSIKKPKYCPVLGYRLQHHKNKAERNSYSVDRIDPKKGYEIGNVRFISNRANRLLHDATLDELRKIYKYKKKYG